MLETPQSHAIRPGGSAPSLELAERAPIELLDIAVVSLLQRWSAEDVRQALIRRVGVAPAAEFELLMSIFLKHFSR